MTEKDKMVHIMRTGTFSNYPELADLLIKEGFGDIELCGKMLKVADATAEHFKHRSDVAERALYNALEKLSGTGCQYCNHKELCFAQDFKSIDEEAAFCNKVFLEQASKELEEKKKNG